MYVCVSVHKCMGMCVHRKARHLHQITPFITFHLCFWDMVSLWIWSSPIWQEHFVSEFQGSSHLSLPHYLKHTALLFILPEFYILWLKHRFSGMCGKCKKILHLGSFISLQEREFLCIRLLLFFFCKSQVSSQLGALDYIFLY